MAINQVEMIQFIILLINSLLNILLSIRIIIRYFSTKVKELIYVGVAFFLSGILYDAALINFFKVLLVGSPIDTTYIIVCLVLFPFFLFSWILAFTELVYKGKKIVILATLIFIIVFEIIVAVILLNPAQSLIHLDNDLFFIWTPLVTIYITAFFVVFVITAIIFSLKARQSDKKHIRLKGTFILLAIITSIFGFIIETVLIALEFYIIARVLHITAIFLYYFGFLMPKWVRKLFHVEAVEEVAST